MEKVNNLTIVMIFMVKAFDFSAHTINKLISQG